MKLKRTHGELENEIGADKLWPLNPHHPNAVTHGPSSARIAPHTQRGVAAAMHVHRRTATTPAPPRMPPPHLCATDIAIAAAAAHGRHPSGSQSVRVRVRMHTVSVRGMPHLTPTPPTARQSRAGLWRGMCRPRGPMDKASAHGAGDCRFESCRGQQPLHTSWRCASRHRWPAPPPARTTTLLIVAIVEEKQLAQAVLLSWWHHHNDTQRVCYYSPWPSIVPVTVLGATELAQSGGPGNTAAMKPAGCITTAHLMKHAARKLGTT